VNYLQLCKETARLSGTVDPRSIETVDAPGRIGLIAALVQAAWTEIQSSTQSWRFLVAEYPETAELPANQNRLTHHSLNLIGLPPEPVEGRVYPPPWSNWILGGAGSVPLTIWRLSGDRGDEQPLVVLDYQAFRASYQTGVSRGTKGRPQAVAVDQQDGLVFWPMADEIYRLSGTYRRAPQILGVPEKPGETPDGTVPIVAEEFHRLIAWAGKLLLDHHDEADGNVLLADLNLPMTFEASMASLRRRYLSGGLSIGRSPIGGSNPGGFRPVPGLGRPTTVGFGP